MKYFVSSDIHGFYDEWIKALKEKGFNKNNPNHKLIICGDLFDRGNQSKEVYEYLSKLNKDKYIYIRGNHEDLLFDCYNEVINGTSISEHHISNGTLDTIVQFTNIDLFMLLMGFDADKVRKKMKPILNFISKSIDYYETKNYIFVHGWIPFGAGDKYKPSWRLAPKAQWKQARWTNGIEAWQRGVREDNKTIICGHWHCSALWHLLYPDKYDEFGEKENFTTCKGDGIIAIDGCTAHSHIVNVEVIDDEEVET